MSRGIKIKIKMEDPIAMFVEAIVNEIDWGQKLEPEVLSEIKKDYYSRVEDMINRALIEALPEEKLEEMNKILDKESDDDEAILFIKNNVKNFDEIVLNEMLRFKSLYINSIKSNKYVSRNLIN